MPSSIPYDPSLVMGQIVNSEAIKNVETIAKLEAPADAAQDKYNGLLASKRSLDMTLIELTGLKLGEDALKPLQEEIEAFNKTLPMRRLTMPRKKSRLNRVLRKSAPTFHKFTCNGRARWTTIERDIRHFLLLLIL
jgi:hypothetical protein